MLELSALRVNRRLQNQGILHSVTAESSRQLQNSASYVHKMSTISRCLSAWRLAFYRATATLIAVYAVVVCLCLCVCLSHSSIVSKRLNVGSRKQRRTIAHDSSFLVPKIMAKLERDHPLRGRQMQVGWVKIIGHFRRKTRYNSKTVQDRRIVSIKVE